MTAQDVTLVIAGTLTSLLAGLFLAFVIAVNLGLGRLSDADYLAAMQSINTRIQNGLFSLIFMGPVLLLPVSAWLNRSNPGRLPLLIAASALYILLTFGITAGGNVPLNNRLDKVSLTGIPDAQARAVRGWFEQPWQRLHVIRTLAAVAATVLTFVACLR